jgi:hypothetical protein
MAKNPTKAPAELVAITVLSAIFDGEMHPAGETMELPAAEAKALVDIGVAEYAAADAKPAE